MPLLSAEDQRELNDLFDPFPGIPYNPALPYTAQQHVRNALKLAGKGIFESVPRGRERALAITNLQQAMFWALKGLPIIEADGAA